MSNVKPNVLYQIALQEGQTQQLTQPTPNQHIKTKPGRGGKQVKFVEGGYVINQLNRVFGPLNWTFRITERGETKRVNEKNAEGEVWVYGELTIHDHKRGYSVAKGQYGQHPIHSNVPIGDALKAAGTDALKKCASLLGVALDVYWGQLDQGRPEVTTAPLTTQAPQAQGVRKPPKEPTVYERAEAYIRQTTDRQTLANAIQRIEDTQELTGAEKYRLTKLVNEKLGIKTEPGKLAI